MFNFRKKKEKKEVDRSNDNIGFPPMNPSVSIVRGNSKILLQDNAYSLIEPKGKKPNKPSSKISYYRGEEFDLGDFQVFSINLENLEDIVFRHSNNETELVRVDLGMSGYILVEIMNSKILKLKDRDRVAEEIYQRAAADESYLKIQLNYGILKKAYNY